MVCLWGRQLEQKKKKQQQKMMMGMKPDLIEKEEQ